MVLMGPILETDLSGDNPLLYVPNQLSKTKLTLYIGRRNHIAIPGPAIIYLRNEGLTTLK